MTAVSTSRATSAANAGLTRERRRAALIGFNALAKSKPRKSGRITDPNPTTMATRSAKAATTAMKRHATPARRSNHSGAV